MKKKMWNGTLEVVTSREPWAEGWVFTFLLSLTLPSLGRGLKTRSLLELGRSPRVFTNGHSGIHSKIKFFITTVGSFYRSSVRDKRLGW